MRINWAAGALSDLESIGDYIGADNPDAAIAAVLAICNRVNVLAEHPGLGRPGRVEGTRELIIPGLPYVIPYVCQGGTITVLRVFHGAMKWPARF